MFLHWHELWFILHRSIYPSVINTHKSTKCVYNPPLNIVPDKWLCSNSFLDFSGDLWTTNSYFHIVLNDVSILCFGFNTHWFPRSLLSHTLYIKMDDMSPLCTCIPDINAAILDNWSESLHLNKYEHVMSVWLELPWNEQNYLTSNLTLLDWSMSHPLIWRRQDSWPILQPTTRWWSRCCGFTFGELSCLPSIYTVYGISIQCSYLTNRILITQTVNI